jgi:hypothetical protein
MAPPWPMPVLAALGLAIAGYLTLVQLDLLAEVWDPLFGAASSRAVLDLTHPVPDAAAGTVAYVAELVLLLVRRARTLLGLILLAGAITSVALIAIQPTIVGHWCALCLASAATSVALLGLGHAEARAALATLRHPNRAIRTLVRQARHLVATLAERHERCTG